MPTHPDTNIDNLDEKPFPEFFTPLGNNHDALADRLIVAMQSEGIAVHEAAINRSEGESRGKQVVIKQGLDSTNKCLTLLHEWTHELLHQSREDRGRGLGERVRECHAEAVTFIVAQHFGIHSPFSADYLLSWGNTPEKLLAEFEMVQKAAKYIITAIEKPYQEGDSNTEQKPGYTKRATHMKRRKKQ